jgi:hypothetical protein
VSGQVRPVYLHPGSQAQALGAALGRLGFTAEVLTWGAHLQHPCVVVDSGPGRAVAVTEYVYAAPDEAGLWWFWLSCSRLDPVDLEPVAPISDVSATADHLARALTCARAQQTLAPGALAGQEGQPAVAAG